MRCSASRGSADSASAQHAAAAVCRRDFLAAGTAAIAAGVASLAAAEAGAATQLPSIDGPVLLPPQSRAQALWDVGAASATSSSERADLVSPTVLPQLSSSERQVCLTSVELLSTCHHVARRRSFVRWWLNVEWSRVSCA